MTPKHQDHLAHLSTWMPFERARQMLEALLGIQVSEPTARRGTERAGAVLEARETTQSLLPATAGPVVAPCEKQVVSLDGCYVPLVKGQWVEVRTTAIGEVNEKISRKRQEPQTQHLSYFSRMMDAETFGQRAEVELRR
ncbi:MAG: ISKra4 family transposase, partial [Ktedonobacteraceae bacterium]|nr:ISKra4 family transposase [Ktedonobacteraceae bacterium]